jgi:hypothetical protein
MKFHNCCKIKLKIDIIYIGLFQYINVEDIFVNDVVISDTEGKDVVNRNEVIYYLICLTKLTK